MNREPYYVTPDGLKKLQDKLAELIKVRERLIERIKEAKEMGDLSENAEYQSAREAHVLNETHFLEIKDLLKRATVIKKNGNGHTVSLGSVVTLKQGLRKIIFTVVGPEESDPAAGFISHISPLGSALLNRKEGDEVTIKNAAGQEISYKVVKIE